MSFAPQTWSQLKNVTADDLVRALTRDGFVRDLAPGAIHIYRHPDGRRVSIHYHPKKTYGAKLLKGLLEDAGWSDDRMRDLKLIK